MGTIRSYTTIEQSRILAKFLSIESADMYYGYMKDKAFLLPYSDTEVKALCTPCWSLASLLGVLPSATLDSSNDHYYRIRCMERFTEWYDNPVDACVAMIEKLHKLKRMKEL